MFNLKADHKTTITLKPVDSKGNPAEVENPQFTSSDDTLLTVTQDGDNPLKAEVVAVGLLGTAQVQFSVDKIIGEGEEALDGFADVQIVSGQAAALGAEFGEQAPQ